MCFNATTSMITFAIASVCSIYLLYNGLTTHNKYDVYFSIVVLLVGAMQFIEYMLWKNQTCSSTNHFWSLMILVLLTLQNIIAFVAYTMLFAHSQSIHQIMSGICILFVFIASYLVYVFNQTLQCSKPSKNSCRLEWSPFKPSKHDFLIRIFTLLYLGLMVYNGGFVDHVLYKPFAGYSKYPVRFSIVPLTFILSIVYSYWTEGERWVDIYGSVWCFSAISLGVVSCLHL
jgi:hypothetical protein